MKEMKMIMFNDLKSHYTIMINGLVDKCTYLDLDFVLLTFLIKKKQSLRSKEKRLLCRKSIPSPNNEMVNNESNDEPPKKLKGLAAMYTETQFINNRGDHQ